MSGHSRFRSNDDSTFKKGGNIILAISFIGILLASTTLTGTLLARTSIFPIPQEQQQQALKIWSDSLPALSQNQAIPLTTFHTKNLSPPPQDSPSLSHHSAQTPVPSNDTSDVTKKSNSTRPANMTSARSNFTTIRIVQNFTNIRGPVKVNFVNSYWTYNTAQDQFVAGTTSARTPGQSILPVIKQEVGPGEGQSLLAVVLINEGFSAITGLTSSLKLPQGFEPLLTPKQSSIPGSDPQTALSSYDGVVNPGGAFTLYFPVKVLSNAQVGKQYNAYLKLGYVKVTELRQKLFRTAMITVPFTISGKVILDVVTSSPSPAALSNISSLANSPSLLQTLNLIPGNPNAVKLTIQNDGSATARGVIVSIAGLTSASPSSTTVTVGTNVTSGVAPQAPSSSTVILGSKVFNVGSIPAGGSQQITVVIYPSISGAGSVQTLNLGIMYNDAYGNKKTTNQIIGLQILPISPQSGLSVTPSTPPSSAPPSSAPPSSAPPSSAPPSSAPPSSAPPSSAPPSTAVPSSSIPLSISPMAATGKGLLTSDASLVRTSTNLASTSTNSNLRVANPSSLSQSNSPSLIEIAAGRVQNVTFAIHNENAIASALINPTQNSMTDLAVSLTPQNNSVKILGPSSWNIPTIASASGQLLTTQVFAPVSLMYNPIVFTVAIQYIQNNHQVKSANFDLGAMVVGDIQLKLDNLRVQFNGNTPTLVGNILNEGNTPALYASVETVKQGQSPSQAQLPFSSSLASENNLETVLTANSTQYIGNILLSSPHSLNVPLQEVHLLGARTQPLSKMTLYQNTKDKSPFQTRIAENSSDNESRDSQAGNTQIAGTYPVLLRITYSDGLKNIHQLILSSPLQIEPKQPQNSSPWLAILIGLLILALGAGIFLLLRLSIERRSKFTAYCRKLTSRIRPPNISGEPMKTNLTTQPGKRDGAPF